MKSRKIRLTALGLLTALFCLSGAMTSCGVLRTHAGVEYENSIPLDGYYGGAYRPPKPPKHKKHKKPKKKKHHKHHD